MQNKSSSVILCCIAAVVMLMTQCVCGGKKQELFRQERFVVSFTIAMGWFWRLTTLPMSRIP